MTTSLFKPHARIPSIPLQHLLFILALLKGGCHNTYVCVSACVSVYEGACVCVLVGGLCKCVGKYMCWGQKVLCSLLSISPLWRDLISSVQWLLKSLEVLPPAAGHRSSSSQTFPSITLITPFHPARGAVRKGGWIGG